MGKRKGEFQRWEPFYIGTQGLPYYDERLTWEGKSNKMTQGYILCLLDYEFAVLNNAFVTHKPGFKTTAEAARPVYEKATKKLIDRTIRPELDILYGSRKGCFV